MTSAFAATPPALLNSLTTLSSGGSCVNTRLRPRTAISRRQRTPPILCDAGGSEKVKDDESKKDGDSEDASDLVLPDLQALFSSAGDPDCEQCKGEGEVSCMVCGGKGFFTLTMMDTVSSTQCRLCRGKRVMPCPSCRKEVYNSVLWWDLIPSKEDDPEEKWREGPDGEPRIRWSDNPANPGS